MIKRLWLVALFVLCGCSQAASVVEGKDYTVLPMAHSVSNPKKVEVLEFFWYACSHCYKLDPKLSEFMKKQAADVSLVRVHVVWGENSVPLARLAATMATTKTESKLHWPAFKAIFEEHVNLADAKVLATWLKTQKGINAKKFMATYNSFSVNAAVARYKKMTTDYAIDSTPVVIVNGKYQVAALEPDSMMPVIQELINKSRKEKK